MGGWCPKGRKTEGGALDERYELTETPGGGYLQPTEGTVRDSDASVIFTMNDRLEGGSKRTAEFADRHGNSWLHMWPAVHPRYLAAFVAKHKVVVLNVARGRRRPRGFTSSFWPRYAWRSRWRPGQSTSRRDGLITVTAFPKLRNHHRS